MCNRLDELRNKQVVCIHSGDLLGYVGDIEFDVTNGKIVSLIIYGKNRALGLFGKTQDIIIPWCDIEVIGQQTVLVKSSSSYCK